MTRVGFIGAGRMGLPMVRKLAEAGHEVRALGRSSETRAALTGAGVTAVTEASETGVGAELVLVCVFTDDQVREVCLKSALLEKMPRGSVLAIHTTISPRTIEQIRDDAAGHGIDVIDAAVSGGPHDIAAGSLTLFLGGDADAVERATPVLRSYGDPVLHVGKAGNGQRVKLVNNALFAAQIGLISEAVALGAQLGVEESALLQALPHGSSASKVMGNIAARGSVAGFTSAVKEFLTKDVAVVRDTVAELGGDLGALDVAIDAG
ncbi:NAD(P)-dependent oxidoreductase [Rhodococcus sp. HM1]|uniref:NAD(P)-dependent oxidoreductase n=1 Tax=Rhodococcus sp. HM1 TaxID=2937759 RepID=UPI00200AF533|nr:NAD(P)-dependent oxidoreductase [Rhodococcus sp. HM1]MCK8670381.1 NAD(P)-dependent oxidoreductase [Rhodococcus sp. HM1]